MTNLNQPLRSFNRYELKYLISLQQAEKFKSDLRAFLVPDGNGNHKGRYTLTSLYYDSPDLRCYWEKESGIKVRRKLRIRLYASNLVLAEDTPVFLEIKQRDDRVTRKRRAIQPYGEALRLCNDRRIPTHAEEDRDVIEEIYAFLWQYNLRPVMIVRYNRQAFIGTKYDTGLRVTFDTSISFQAQKLHLHEQPSGIPLLPANRVVMEIKVNDRIPRWLTDMIGAHNLQMVQVSKYCRSIDAAQKIRPNNWLKPISEPSQEVLSTSFSIFNMTERKAEISR